MFLITVYYLLFTYSLIETEKEVKFNKRGFNLIELVVAIAIFGLISTAVIANLRGVSPSREVQQQADNVASLLRQAQVQAFAGEPFNGVVPTGGYGVYFMTCSTPPCSVYLFADFNNDFNIDSTNPGSSELVQSVSLGDKVTIDAVSFGSPTSVVFKPPRPYICFNNTCSGAGQVRIKLGSIATTKTVDVLIDQVSGQISS